MNFKLHLSSIAALLLLATPSFSQIVGMDDFDGGEIFVSRTFDPDLSGSPIPGTFPSETNASDVFGIVDRLINFRFEDATFTAMDPGATGLVPSTKTDSFLGIQDLNNGDNPSAMGAVIYEINIAGVDDLMFSADFTAWGDFESSDSVIVSASIDGGEPQILIELTPNEDIAHTYTFEDGVTTADLNDPMTIDGTIVDNNFANFSANITGTGSLLTIRIDCTGDGGSELIAIDNVVIEGSSGKEPLLGDVNCDGEVNLLDVQPFVEAVSNSAYDVKADVNEDGADNLLDVAPFVDLLTGV